MEDHNSPEPSSDSLPPLTVVIPAYNLERYLPDAVTSVLCQTYQGPVSIVVLDDGSTDGTLEIANQLASKDGRLRVHTQANQGRVGARNRLLSLAETDIVAWLDADDIASPDWLVDQVTLLTSDENNAAVSGQGYAMTSDAYPIGPIDAHPLTHAAIHERHMNGKANAFFQSCVVVRKSMVDKAGNYRTKYPAGEDFDLWLRLADVGQLQNIDRRHLIYRVHDTSANSTISVQQRQQGWQATNEARARKGLAPLAWIDEEIPPPRKDEWNRRIYWIHIAIKSGNPWTALRLAWPAWLKFPFSAVIVAMMLVAMGDVLLFRGNRTDRFRAGQPLKIQTLPTFSCYNLARNLYRLRARIRRR